MRMSDTEAVMWAVEKDPALRSDFCNLTILDHAPDEKRLRATLDRALVAIPRLRQRVVAAPLRIVPPEFATTRASTSTTTCAASRCPRPATRARVLDVCEQLAESSARPVAPAVGVHADRRARGRTGRAAAEDPPHDQRRRRRAEALAGAPRPRARTRRVPDDPDAGTRARRTGSTRARRRAARRRHATRRVATSTRCAGVAGGTAGALVRPMQLPGAASTLCASSRSVRPPGLRRRHARTRISSRTGRCAATSRCTRVSLAGAEGGRERARRQRQRRVRHRALRAASAAITSATAARSTSCAWRCRSARAAAATTPPTASHRRGCSSRSNRRRPGRVVRRGPRPLGDGEAGAGARPRSRTRRVRDAPPDRVPRRVHAEPGAHDRLRGVEPARQPVAALPRGRAHRRELPVRPARRAPRST